jgi:hypothetical protein
MPALRHLSSPNGILSSRAPQRWGSKSPECGGGSHPKDVTLQIVLNAVLGKENFSGS